MIEEINLRPVKSMDCKLIWKWRNDLITRKYSSNSEYIPYEKHKKWFRDSLKNKDREILIVVKNSNPVGIVRFDKLSDIEFEVHINIAPEYRSMGIAKQALKKSCKNVFKKTDAKKISAKLKKDNESSIKVFRDVGFVIEKYGEIIKMSLIDLKIKLPY